MRRRTWSRRRSKAGFRWFTPGLWTSATLNPFSSVSTVAPATSLEIEASVVPLLSGAAPFPGVNNSAGRLAGRMLAERQYYSIRRVVGRHHWWLAFAMGGDDVTLTAPMFAKVNWGIIRWNTDELGVPDSTTSGQGFFDLSLAGNQDDRKTILWQDTWIREFPESTVFPAEIGRPFEIPGPGPLFNMVDARLRRPIGNEQELFLAATVKLWSWNDTDNIPSGSDISLWMSSNLRPYGRLGR